VNGVTDVGRDSGTRQLKIPIISLQKRSEVSKTSEEVALTFQKRDDSSPACYGSFPVILQFNVINPSYYFIIDGVMSSHKR